MANEIHFPKNNKPVTVWLWLVNKITENDCHTAQKMTFSIKDFFSKCDFRFLPFPADLITFTEEILNGKLHFLCSVVCGFSPSSFKFKSAILLLLTKQVFKNWDYLSYQVKKLFLLNKLLENLLFVEYLILSAIFEEQNEHKIKEDCCKNYINIYDCVQNTTLIWSDFLLISSYSWNHFYILKEYTFIKLNNDIYDIYILLI